MKKILGIVAVVATLAIFTPTAFAAGHGSWNNYSGHQWSGSTFKTFDFSGYAGNVAGLDAYGGVVKSEQGGSYYTEGGGSSNQNQVNAWQKSGTSGGNTTTVYSPGGPVGYIVGSGGIDSGGGTVQFDNEYQATNWNGGGYHWH